MANPDPETFSGAVADAYHTAAAEAEHEVIRYNLCDLNFDPILHKGYKEIQTLEPDLEHVQESIAWADHLVIVYPNWWCTMPALLKGLFDRIWLPGFAFNFNKETNKIDRHLNNKTAHVFIVSGTHSPLKNWWLFGDYTNEIQHGILGFAGIKSEITVFGPSDKVSEPTKEKWLGKAASFGKKGC